MTGNTRSEQIQRAVAVVAVTRQGSVLAARIAARLPRARAVVPARFHTEAPAATAYDGPLAAVVGDCFRSRSDLVLVMAAGAAVRLIAPHLRDKMRDPAVVVVDDGGRFAIALLSGHVGGANALAEAVAAVIGARPVITTASEARGAPAADLIGRDFGWRVENPADLKTLAAALVNGDPVGLMQEAGEQDWHTGSLPSNVARYARLAELLRAGPHAAILISDRSVAGMARSGWVWYRPRTLVLGIGCIRGASEAEIADLTERTLAAHDLSPLSLRAVATLDRKADEPGLLAFARARDLPLHSYPAAELDGVTGIASPSEIVRAAVGIASVCEAAALRCAGTAQLLVPKHKSASVTVAVARSSCAAARQV